MKHAALLFLVVLSACQREEPAGPRSSNSTTCPTTWAYLEQGATWQHAGILPSDTARVVGTPYFCGDPDVLRVDVEYTGQAVGHSFLLVADSSAVVWNGTVATVPAWIADVTADTDPTPATRDATMHNLHGLQLAGATEVVLLVDGQAVTYAW